ncbi:hypothetical protein K6H10_004991 [Candida tropicalis]
MNLLLRRFNSTFSNGSLFLKSIDKLSLRVKNEQAQHSGALLKCIDLLIEKYQPLLIQKFNINPNISDQYKIQQEIWDHLKRMRSIYKDNNKRLREKSMKNNQVLYTKEYREFIRELYPINIKSKKKIFDSEVKYFDFVNNSKKHLNINHDELYKRYLDLPSPAPRYMNHEDLENFINNFILRRKHYANSNQIEGCIIKENFQGAIKTINRQNEDRKIYKEMCIKVINDIHMSNLPVTRNEQIRLIYLSYFKDRQDIIKYIDKNNEKLNYPEYNWNDYSAMLESFGERDDILGILLFLATRHDKFDIIKDILPRVGLGELINSNNINSSMIKLKDISLNHLLFYFTYYIIDRPEYEMYLTNTIDYITNNVSIIETEMINAILSSLIQLGHIKQAQMLFEAAFFQDVGSSQQDIDNSETILYKKFTSEDGQIFKEWLSIFINLKEITQDKDIIYKLIPRDTSFVVFIDGYCKYGEFSQVKQMIYIMENFAKQPLTTRMYTRIFTGFMKRAGQSGWELDEFIEILTRLVRDIDGKESTPGYLNKLINDGSVEVPDHGEPTSSSMMIGQHSSLGIYENTNILRLSNLLMETIISGLESLLQSEGNTTHDDALESLKNLRDKREVMLENQHQKAGSVYYADRLDYVNRAILFETFSIVSRL